MQKLLLSFFFGFLLFVSSLAQQPQTETNHSCFADEIMNDMLLQNPLLQQIVDSKEQIIKNYLDSLAQFGTNSPESGPLTIPVVVFVVHENGIENITDAQVISQINILNTYFNPYDLKFCLATKKGPQDITTINTPTGITSNTAGIFHYENSTLTNHNTNTSATLAATGNAFSSANYLKIWVVKRIRHQSLPPWVKVLGYSYLPQFSAPGTDGVYMSYDVFGDINTCACTTLDQFNEQGKVLVHEIGHYLGLYHTFQGGCSGMSTSNCATQGDRVCDTPPVASPNNNCPANNWNSCNEVPDLPDDVNNYMDYTSENCKNQFSQGQKNRMFAQINLYRSNLVSSSNMTYTGTTCNGNLVADFTGDNFNPCVGDTVNFSSIPAVGVTHSWDFGDGTTGSGLNVSHVYSSHFMPTSVVLTVTDGTNTAAATKLIYVDTCPPINSSQGNWYLSLKGGMNFSSGAPVYDNNSFVNNNWINEASVVQSNDQGELLFYTNGKKLWDQNHSQINSSNELLGGESSHHGAISVPDPGNPNEYYLFTRTAAQWINNILVLDTGGYRYSKVAINGTQASMTSSWNIPVTLPSSMGFVSGQDNAILGGEGITAIKSCDGYWIITTAKKTTEFSIIIHSLTANGFAFHNEWLSPYSTTQQALKASQDGKRLVIGSGTGSTGQTTGLTLYDFDTYTGTISNPVTVTSGDKVYGMAFSPNAKLLYTASWGGGALYQHDLNHPNPSQTGLKVVLFSGAPEIQRGPNNKLYLTRFNSNNVQVIHQPNVRMSADFSNECHHSFNGPLMETNTTYAGLPNMIDAREEMVFSNSLSYNQLDCETYHFSPSICSGTYSWNFGDPTTGANNNSTQITPTHVFSGPGVYIVSVIGNGTTLTETIEIGTQSTIQGAPSICINTNALGNYSTNLQPGQTAIWTINGGGITGLDNQSDVFITWLTLPGTVTVTVTDTTTGCESTSTFNVIEDCSTNGLEDFAANEFIKVYPNPSSGSICISLSQEIESSAIINLKSLDGKVISNIESTQKEIIVEIPNTVSNGILFVEVQSNGSTFTKKVILMK